MRRFLSVLLFIFLTISIHAAEIVRYVDPDSAEGGDGTTWTLAYDSLFDWEAAEQTNLDTANNWMHVYVRASSGTDDTTGFTITGWTTSATDYIFIEAASGDEAIADGWDDNRYSLHISGDSTAMTITETFVRLNGLQIKLTNAADSNHGILYNTGTTPNDIRFSNCRITGVLSGTASANVGVYSSATTSNLIFSNLIVEGWDTTNALGIYARNGTLGVYNSTIYGNTTGIRIRDHNGTIKNSAIFKNGNDILDSAGGSTIDYCATDDNDGTNIVAESGGGAEWPDDFEDAAAGDFRLKSGSNLVDAGTDDPSGSGYGDPDINGTARASPWDVGAYEFPAAAGGSVATIMNETRRRFWFVPFLWYMASIWGYVVIRLVNKV